MATYRFSAQLISRSKGRSATAAAAYRAGERIRDDRTGETFDYRRRDDILDATIYAPACAPEWVFDRASLWNVAELAEKRRDAQVAREVQLSLPHELSLDANRELLRLFVAAEFVARGMVADVAIHAPHRGGDERNVHAHVLLSTREIDTGGFGKKQRAWNDRALLEHWRAAWELAVNHALETERIPARVFHKSYARLGIDREAEPKQGPIATTMERRGRESHAGRDRRAVRDRNARRELLRNAERRLDSSISREAERRLESYDGNNEGREVGAVISSPERDRWRVWREEVLSDHYAADLRGSNLARFWRIERRENGLVFSNARGQFVDEGSRITAQHGNELEVRGMLEAAKAHGWSELVISGTDDFKRRAMRAGLEQGFSIKAIGRDLELLEEVQVAARDTRREAYRRDREVEFDR